MSITYDQKFLKSINCKIDLLKVSDNLTVSPPVSLPKSSFRLECSIGAFTYIGTNCFLRSVSIGNYCSIATDVIFGPNQHPVDWLSTHSFVFGDNAGFKGVEDFYKIKTQPRIARKAKPITIGNDVWIGARAIIMGGVHIGDGAIIAANSVVTKNVPPYTIFGGVPAKYIKKRFNEEIIDQLLSLQWWKYLLDKKILVDIDYSDINSSIKILKKLIDKKTLATFDEKYLIDGKNKKIIKI
jgi:acetyltransferase-like isoleucine patch superfamily enzyme